MKASPNKVSTGRKGINLANLDFFVSVSLNMFQTAQNPLIQNPNEK